MNGDSQRRKAVIAGQSLFLLAVIFFLAFGYMVGIVFPPTPEGVEPVIISGGMNADDIARMLKERGVIRSSTFFVWATYLGGMHDRLAAGKFTFTNPQSLFGVLSTLATQQKEITLLVPEGSTVREIEELLKKNNMLAYLDFSKNAAEKEGFLFPDTYRFYETAEAVDIIRVMNDNFLKKIALIQSDIEQSGKSLNDIIILASIIEKEVRTDEDKAIAAGILERRLEAGMPLQVDATLFYELGKNSRELTKADLENPTPYNTYVKRGLPPTPIGNPGLSSIRAVLAPQKTSYLYYLSDSEGKIHYARTFDEHKANKAKYIK